MPAKLILAAALAAAVATPLHATPLKWAAQNDILTFDPHSQNHATSNAMSQHVYEGLVRYTKDYKI